MLYVFDKRYRACKFVRYSVVRSPVYIILAHCTKCTHAIGQNRSRVFLLPGNNEFCECVIVIMHKNRALLKMAFCNGCKAVGSRFLRVSEDEINQTVDNAMSKSIKSQTNWCTSIFEGK